MSPTQESQELTTCKRPSEIVVLDALPASSTGKILKHRLGDAAHDQARRRSGALT